MLAARGERVRPHLDDKVLASWNGLMLGAFARAFAVLAMKPTARRGEEPRVRPGEIVATGPRQNGQFSP